MDIIVPFSIRKREMGGLVDDEAKKIFQKLKASPALAVMISAKGLPPNTTLHKVYATSAGGAKRLLFFYKRPSPAPKPAKGVGSLLAPDAPLPPEEWVLVFYRNKGDPVGDNMSPKNAAFSAQLISRLALALADMAADTPESPRCEQF